MTRHRPARPFRKKADDFRSGPFVLHENRGNDARFQRLFRDGTEIFLTGAIYQHISVHGFSLRIQRLGNIVAPIVIKRCPPSGFQTAAHFQTIRLDRIQRAQQAIKPGQNPQMILRILRFIRRQCCGIQPLIGIARKSQHRRARHLRLWRIGKRLKPVAVQPRQIIAQVHQRLELAQRQIARRAGQSHGIVLHRRDSRRHIPRCPVQPFGRGNHHQHRITSYLSNRPSPRPAARPERQGQNVPPCDPPAAVPTRHRPRRAIAQPWPVGPQNS